MNSWLRENLVCPRDHSNLLLNEEGLVCAFGHIYPVIDGIPIMLLEETKPTHGECLRTLELVSADKEASYQPDEELDRQDTVDSYVQQVVGGTCGHMYRPLIGKLSRYPIPEIRLPQGSGQILLDIGCNWGRWCISAARKGYSCVGIDPSLRAIRAACRVARQLGVSVSYIVADARYLPFAPRSLDIVFSYSVFQHFSKDDVRETLAEVARTLKTSGVCLVQMLNVFGVRNLYMQCKRGFKEAKAFEVRYWRPYELKRAFSEYVGPTSLSVDGFFSANAQTSDIDLLLRRYRIVVYCSEVLRRASEQVPWLIQFADSLYVKAIRRPE